MQHPDGRKLRVALVAHDERKPAITQWAKDHLEDLRTLDLYATGTTGTVISDETGLEVTKLLSGPLGGDQQLGAMIAEEKLDALIFFIDPMTALPHDVDVKALLRVSTLYQTAVATNENTASLLLMGLKQKYSNSE